MILMIPVVSTIKQLNILPLPYGHSFYSTIIEGKQ